MPAPTTVEKQIIKNAPYGVQLSQIAISSRILTSSTFIDRLLTWGIRGSSVINIV
jgi:hypothetical protein